MTTRRALTLTLTLALAVTALPLLVAAAGPGNRPDCTGDGPGPFARGGGPGMHGPGGCAGPDLERFLDRAATRLGLSEEQRLRIEAILETARPQMQALREQARSQHEAFRASHDPAVFDDGAVRAFAAQQSELHAEMMVQGMRTWSEVLQVLTPEQREQLGEQRQKMQDRRGQRGHRGGGWR